LHSEALQSWLVPVGSQHTAEQQATHQVWIVLKNHLSTVEDQSIG